MTDYYTQVCFAIEVTDDEASLITEVQQICEELADGFATADQEAARHAASSAAFRDMFPAEDPAQPFEKLRAMFSDPSWPNLSASFAVSERDDGPGKMVEVTGDTVDPWEIASLLRLLAPSATPFSFGYAHTASRDRHDAYGGGYIEVRRDKLVDLVERHENTDDQRLVIAMIDPDEGLQFWNNRDGFGSLEVAAVFTERDAANFDLPIAAQQPEWLALPPRHAFFKELP
jgi:hypothetical protein